jgi:hypothetical protein
MELPTISSEKIERFCYESRAYFIKRLKSSKRALISNQNVIKYLKKWREKISLLKS